MYLDIVQDGLAGSYRHGTFCVARVGDTAEFYGVRNGDFSPLIKALTEVFGSDLPLDIDSLPEAPEPEPYRRH